MGSPVRKDLEAQISGHQLPIHLAHVERARDVLRDAPSHTQRLVELPARAHHRVVRHERRGAHPKGPVRLSAHLHRLRESRR